MSPYNLAPPVDDGTAAHRSAAGWLRRVEALLDGLSRDRRFLLALMAPNLVGIVVGYYYYWQVGQFDPASRFWRNPAWWPFIPDSPNAVLAMSVALLVPAFGGRRSRLLDHVAFTAMVYVGLWTTMLFLSYPERMGTFDWAGVMQGNSNPVLFVSHMGMPLEALLVVPRLRRDPPAWGLVSMVVAWNVLNLGLDYWGPHLHPAPHLHDAGAPPPATSPFDAALHARSPIVMAIALAAWMSAEVACKAKTRVEDPPHPEATPFSHMPR